MTKFSIFILTFVCLSVLASEVMAAEYYISPTGNDTNPGTLTSPWKTLKTSLTKLTAGDTLNLRGGTYYEGNITTSLKGTASAPIVIHSYPGERAVIDGGVPDYKTVPNTGWELVNASIGLYRTTQTYSGTVGAWLVNDDTQLIQYDDQLNMESTYYGPLDQSHNLYFGPGVQLRSDGKLYIRLQSNPKDLDAQDPDGGGGDGFGNDLPAVPSDPNPNNNSIAVFTTQTLITLQGAAYLQFKDLTFQYAKKIMDWQTGTNNITLENCTINYGTSGILQTGADTALIKNCEFNNGVPMTMFWTDVKNGIEGGELVAGGEGYPEFQSGALSATPNMTIEGSTVTRTFDGISLVPGVGNVTIRNNYFLITKDDAINLSLDNYNVEIDHNLLWYIHSGISLFKHTGTPGEVYIHHNVVDGSLLTRTGRPGNYRQQSYIPWAGGNPFSGHDGKSPAHWKVYNNTFISQKGRQTGSSMSPDAVTGNSSKYLYNNIFFAHDNRILLSDDQESTGSHYDGDVFWQGISGTMFSNFANGGSYISLADLQAASSWEDNGLQTDPGFDTTKLLTTTFDKATAWQQYTPTNSQVFTLGINFAGLDWPGTEGVNYRGALDQTSQASPTSTPTPTLKPGDANEDGTVDSADYAIWLSFYNTQTSNGHKDGDFNADAKVDGIDYVIWLNNYGI